jgi:hypothetical protein
MVEVRFRGLRGDGAWLPLPELGAYEQRRDAVDAADVESESNNVPRRDVRTARYVANR